MGRELQKKKNRSSISKARRKPKSKKRILQHPIIAANWDKSQTLSQNYQRLGLTARLNKSTGGTEKKVADVEREREEGDVKQDGLRIGVRSKKAVEHLTVQEARIERDPETGTILRVVDEERRSRNPLGDPLNDSESDSGDDEIEVFDQHGHVSSLGNVSALQPKTEVVRKLESESQRPEKRYKRKQSESERGFIEALVKKYGDDYERMARDMEINYMQRSAGDLKRRVRKWREAGEELISE